MYAVRQILSGGFASGETRSQGLRSLFPHPPKAGGTQIMKKAEQEKAHMAIEVHNFEAERSTNSS